MSAINGNDGSSSTLAANALPPVSISLHVPNSDLAFSYQSPTVNSKIGANNQSTPKISSTSNPPPTSSSGSNSSRPHPSGLETLPEASHANALNQAKGPSPTSLPPLASTPDLSHLTPIQRSLLLARNDGYDSVLVEIANERWRERWERLCLSLPNPSNEEGATNSTSQTTSPPPANGHMYSNQGLNPPEWGSKADPGLMGGSWEVINGTPSHPAPSQGGMKKSSSRQGIASGGGNVKSGSIFRRKNKGSQETPLYTVPQTQPVNSSPAQPINVEKDKGTGIHREADEWRAAPSFRRGELNVTKLEETDSLTAIISPWLELDSLDEGIRLDSDIALNQEVAYASYLGIQNIILPAPSSDPERRPFLADYARAVSGLLRAGGEGSSAVAGTWMNVAIRMPVSSPHGLGEALSRSSGSSASAMTAAANLRSEDDWAWETWDTIRNLCSYTSRLSLVLDLTFPLPGPNSLSRWAAEPVSSIWISSGSFLSNAKGYPVLSKAAQSLLRALLPRRPNLTLFNVNNPPPTHTRGGPSAYLQYIRHLERTAPPEKPVEIFARGYSDWLQAPLQPLMDNLEGGTYDTFERDPVKYALYEEAVYFALKDRPATAAPAKIWVCGAGRGPLVTRCLQAAERAKRAIRVVALEKNPGALIILQDKKLHEWGENRVEIKYGDMRTFDPPRDEKDKADIVVSELLGSFGDNELSPECLDGGMRFAKATGFSIPSSYTTFLSPLSSPKLYTDILSSSTSPATPAQPNAVQKAAETPYVVLFKAMKLLAGEGGRGGWEKIQEGWTFEHSKQLMESWSKDSSGLPLTNAHNVRTSTHTFHIPHAGVCHGLAGYFEAHLYGNVKLSIHPDPNRTSTDMLSWFPIYFPFREPLYLPPNSELDVHMWRLTASRRVWYEWSAEVFLPLPTSYSGLGANGRVSPSSSGNQGHPSSSTSSDSSTTTSTIDNSATHAFQNAPGTPRMPTTPLLDGPPPPNVSQNHSNPSSNSMGPPPLPAHVLQAQAQQAQARKQQQQHLSILVPPQVNSIVRIKTGMTGLMNPGGRSSWIGL